MPELAEQTIRCPYCDESISILVDDSLERQDYIEDCQVCCRPIVIDIAIDPGGDIRVLTRTDSE